MGLEPFPLHAGPFWSRSSNRESGVQHVRHFCYHPQLDPSSKFILVCLPLTECLGQISKCTLLSRKACHLSKHTWNSLFLALPFLHCPCGILLINCWNCDLIQCSLHPRNFSVLCNTGFWNSYWKMSFCSSRSLNGWVSFQEDVRAHTVNFVIYETFSTGSEAHHCVLFFRILQVL